MSLLSRVCRAVGCLQSKIYLPQIRCAAPSSMAVRQFSRTSPASSLHASPPATSALPGQSTALLQRVLQAGLTCRPTMSVRTVVLKLYRPNAMKRLKKHGLQVRLSTKKGRIVLWKRILKGRNITSLPYFKANP